MKRPTKHLSDVDIRGRTRRGPQAEIPPLVPAKFMDGPVAGQTIDVPRGIDYVKVGPWMYSYAGKDGKLRVYCKLPKSRRDHKLLMFIIGKRGADPRVQMAQARSKPVKRTAPSAKGRGARRRVEKRNAAA